MNNLNVFISGVSRGIGNTVAKMFLKKGFTVVGSSRGNFKFEDEYKNFHHVKMDVTSRTDIDKMLKKITTENLLPDILINNAGITSDKLFLKMNDDDWDNVIDTNLNGTFNVTKVFIKNMIKKRFGKIINISSISGLMGNPGQVNYSSSKSALVGFTKSLAKELGSRNINVNCVAPGFIKTEMTSFIDGESEDKIINQIPLNRLGNSEDVAKLIMFLASDEASYITGQTISIDGGLLMY